jgi:hypothetical protein
MNPLTDSSLPVAVIGAGPVGLAAAAQLALRGQAFILLEAGPTVAFNVRGWGHVRLFTPWQYLIDSAARTLLAQTSWAAPDPEYHPTGHELYAEYLQPLAATSALADHIRYDARVIAVARQHHDRMKDGARADAPFVITYQNSAGQEQICRARAVIDASGGKVNPLGAHGVPALGERALAEGGQIFYGVPDVLGDARARYANKRVLVVGSGHSAFNAILDLLRLAEQNPQTEIAWAVRRASVGQMFGGGADDALEARGALGQRVRDALDLGRLKFLLGTHVWGLQATEAGIVVKTDRPEQDLGPFDQIISATGYRPDLAMLSELRLAIHDSTEAALAIAPLIDPNIHSCGTVPPHGARDLSHPEPNFYMVGLKSYGRAPTFLMLTGYEQVRSVAAALAGDWDAADKVELTLPESGCCTSNSTPDTLGCCGPIQAAPTSTVITLGSIG